MTSRLSRVRVLSIVAAAIGFAQRRRGPLAALLAALLGAVVGALSFVLFCAFHSLFPLASFAAVLLASMGISSLPRSVTARRAVQRASELIAFCRERIVRARAQIDQVVGDLGDERA